MISQGQPDGRLRNNSALISININFAYEVLQFLLELVGIPEIDRTLWVVRPAVTENKYGIRSKAIHRGVLTGFELVLHSAKVCLRYEL